MSDNKRGRVLMLGEVAEGIMIDKRLAELPGEIWIEIMKKLTTKLLHICKLVSKEINAHASFVLSRDLPPCGMLFHTLVIDFKPYSKLYYASLGDFEITEWPIRDDPKTEHPNALVEVAYQQHTHMGQHNAETLGNFTLDFSHLLGDAKKQRFWAAHRGLVLLSSNDNYTYCVYNPVTAECLVVPRSPSLPENHTLLKARESLEATIVNLSDCLYPKVHTDCNFRVIRTYKVKGSRCVEVYFSNKNLWITFKLRPNEDIDLDICTAKWSLCGAVFLDDTLFFLTNKRCVVEVKFLPDYQISVHSLHLPQPIKHGLGDSTLHCSQGCLYVSYAKPGYLGIWKHNGSSRDAEAWIPKLLFNKSSNSNPMCKPVIERFLRQIDNWKAEPLNIHLNAPVAFIKVHPSIFAFHLLTDAVEKIAELDYYSEPKAIDFFMFSPCFASLDHLMHQNRSASWFSLGN